MGIKVLFHSHNKGVHCHDGFAAALAFYMKYGDTAEYIPVVHSEEPPHLEPEDSVYIVDFSYPRATLERLKAQVKTLYVLDHHKTAEEALRGLDYCHFDMSKSGAMLAWEHVHETAAPALFAYVQDRDLWHKLLPNQEEVYLALSATPQVFAIWQELALLDQKSFAQIMTAKGAPLLAEKNARIQMLYQLVQIANIGYPHPKAEIPISVVFGSEENADLTSDICDYIIKTSNVNMAAYAYERHLESGEQEHCWSLRSRGDTDVSAIAKSFGGGGHQRAAGFKFRL